MRNLGLILVAFAFTQCANQTLSESEVKDFVTTHFEEKVGYSDAVTPFFGGYRYRFNRLEHTLGRVKCVSC